MSKTNRNYKRGKEFGWGNKHKNKFLGNDSKNPGVSPLLKRITQHSIRQSNSSEILAAVFDDNF